MLDANKQNRSELNRMAAGVVHCLPIDDEEAYIVLDLARKMLAIRQEPANPGVVTQLRPGSCGQGGQATSAESPTPSRHQSQSGSSPK